MSDLIDRQALKNKLKRWDECDPYEFVEIAFHAIEDAPTIAASRWVRCEDELPKRGRLVLAYRGPIAMISAMYTDGCGWRDADLFPMQGVTHWMPIEPPKEDA